MEARSIQEIEKLDSDAQALFGWSAVPLGSLLRTHAYSYRNWGIVVCPENVEYLFAASKKEYQREWVPTDGLMIQMIAEACKKADMLDANAMMNALIAQYADSYVSAIEKEAIMPLCLNVYDIGAGTGGTSAAFVKKLLERGLNWKAAIALTLIEPSESRLQRAVETISGMLVGDPHAESVYIIPKRGLVESLQALPASSADMILHCAAIHHESFNEHMPLIAGVLKPGAPFISGDWHEGTYETPARVYWLYFLLQEPHDAKTAEAAFHFVRGGPLIPGKSERKELGEFRRLFGLDSDMVVGAFEGLSMNEREAVIGGMRYWLEIAKRFGDEGKKSPEVLLQCHERVSKRTEALMNGGFMFDDECRAKYKELLRERGYGELTAVMVAKRRAR